MRKNEYSYVENLVKTFFEGDEYAKKIKKSALDVMRKNI
jgi:hypothetical protein